MVVISLRTKRGHLQFSCCEVNSFHDPNATNNMSAEDVKTYDLRRERYRHIRHVSKSYRNMVKLYEKKRALMSRNIDAQKEKAATTAARKEA